MVTQRLIRADRVKELADGLVVVEGVDDQGNVFAHVAGDIVVFGKKLRGLVNQVSGEQLVEDAIFVGFVEFFQAIGEETEGGTDIDSTGTSFFEERGNFKYCISGGNHIIDENHVFAFKVWLQGIRRLRLDGGHLLVWNNQDVCSTFPYLPPGYWPDR